MYTYTHKHTHTHTQTHTLIVNKYMKVNPAVCNSCTLISSLNFQA